MLPILVRLKDKGVTKIQINFSGSGDSGDIDDLEFYTLTDGREHYINHSDLSDYISNDEYDLLNNESYSCIEDYIEGMDWYNNDGGFGSIIISLESMTAEVEYAQRTTEDFAWSEVPIFDI